MGLLLIYIIGPNHLVSLRMLHYKTRSTILNILNMVLEGGFMEKHLWLLLGELS